MGRTALAYAAAGWAVIPLEGKTPTTGATPRGVKDASRDPERVRAMFGRAGTRATGYGIATGKASGLIVADVDGPDALAEAKRLGLTSGHVVRTGRDRDGWHLYFTVPPGAVVKTRVLAPGLELKAEGAYVVGAGSSHPDTGRLYRAVRAGRPSPAPAWLLELLSTPKSPPTAGRGNRTPTGPDSIDLAGPLPLDPGPIPEGRRNWTLYRLACSMRARGAGEAEILAGLERANAERCPKPLEAPELERIAASAAKHAPGGATGTAATAEVLEALEAIAGGVEAVSWTGVGGKSERDVMIAALKIARRHGQAVPAGVRVSVDYRTLALEAAMGRSSAHRAVQRLRRKGFLSYDNQNRADGQAGALVLRARKVGHSDHRAAPQGPPPGGLVVPPCAPRYSAPRLRWSAPRIDRVGDEYVRTTIRRLGKSCGQAVDVLEYSGGELDLECLYSIIYPHKDPTDRKRWRPRDFRRRVVSRLEAAGVATVHNTPGRLSVALTPDWLDRLNAERENAGEVAAHRRDMARYERERDGWRRRNEPRADRGPTSRELRKYRDSYPERRRAAIAAAIAALFGERPEYRGRRVGQITARLVHYIGQDFPRGTLGAPKDREVEGILDGQSPLGVGSPIGGAA